MTILIENAIPDAQLSITELTEATLDGSGVLDVLLQTMRLHLDREFKSNRITGTAYATVYAQSMAVFLQQAIQYTLSKSRMALELQQLEEQVALIKLQQDQTIAQTNKITTDTVVAIKQGHLVDAQTCQVKAETNRINAEVALRLPEEVELIKRNQLHITAQTDLVTSQDDLAEKELLIKDKTLDLLIAQTAGQQAQNALYTQKTVTERAQIDNTVVGLDSVVDRQNKMMGAQTDGFKRDAEQKSTKLLIDTWSLRKNTDPDATPVNNVNKLVDDTIGAAIQKMMAGIDIVV